MKVRKTTLRLKCRWYAQDKVVAICIHRNALENELVEGFALQGSSFELMPRYAIASALILWCDIQESFWLALC